MNADTEVDLARAEASYCRDRLALMRARHYRWGLGTSPRLEQLERELQRAEQRLSAARTRQRAQGPS